MRDCPQPRKRDSFNKTHGAAWRATESAAEPDFGLLRFCPLCRNARFGFDGRGFHPRLRPLSARRAGPRNAKTVPDTFSSRGSITNVSAANPAVITSPGHGLSNGDQIAIAAVEGETAVNSISPQVHAVSNVTTDTFTVPVDTTGGSAYVPGTGYWGHWEGR
jgi:hypothetical protein